jgi:hypothetical protein
MGLKRWEKMGKKFFKKVTMLLKSNKPGSPGVDVESDIALPVNIFRQE